MRKLLSTNFTFYDNFYKDDNCKKYRSQGIDFPYIPNKEWMDELNNEYIFIWEPQTKRRKKLEVAKGVISRGEYGQPKVYGRYLDKPFYSIGFDEYFPRYCWGDALEFMGIPLTDDNKLSCLVFDNEEEAREYCNKYNEWYEIKTKQQYKDYLNSNEIKNEFNKYLNSIKNVINNIEENDTENFYELINKIYWSDKIFQN